jgi:hypothetical protein
MAEIRFSAEKTGEVLLDFTTCWFPPSRAQTPVPCACFLAPNPPCCALGISHTLGFKYVRRICAYFSAHLF